MNDINPHGGLTRTEMIDANGLSFETMVAGEGERLAVLLHGFPETNYSWRHQIRPLVDMGYTVWAPNMRGYGLSSRPSGVEAYHIDHLQADIGALFDVARARGLMPDLLMSHDWGGIVGWSFVLNRVRPVNRFVAVNIPHPGLYFRNIWKGGQIFKSWYVAFFQIPWLPEQLLTMNKAAMIRRIFRTTVCDRSRFPDEVVDVFARNALIPGAMTAMVNYYRANLRSSKARETGMELQTTDVPTLVLWGDRDVALSVRLLEGTEDLVSDLTVRTLPGVSHWAQQEAPEAVNEALREWLT